MKPSIILFIGSVSLFSYPEKKKKIGSALVLIMLDFKNFLFSNNYKLTGSCKNSSKYLSSTFSTPMITSYITSVQYQNLEIDTGITLLTRVNTFFTFHPLCLVLIIFYTRALQSQGRCISFIFTLLMPKEY